MPQVRAARADVAVAYGAAIAIKLYAWPLAFWLAVTRGVRAGALTVVAAAAFVFVPWALLRFDGVTRYTSLANEAPAARVAIPSSIALSAAPHAGLLAAAVTAAALAACYSRRADPAAFRVRDPRLLDRDPSAVGVLLRARLCRARRPPTDAQPSLVCAVASLAGGRDTQLSRPPLVVARDGQSPRVVRVPEHRHPASSRGTFDPCAA